MNNDLRGAHILVTRPANQAENLCQLIEAQGGIPIRFPTIEIIGVNEGAKATKTNPKLSKYQWLIFTSANAVNFALAANGGTIGQFDGRIAAIGKATAKMLTACGITVNLLPENGFDSEALLAMPHLQQVQGQAVLIIKGKGGRTTLAEGLSERGAMVENWIVYQRVMPHFDKTQVTDLLTQDKLSTIIATSGEALQNLLTILGIQLKCRLHEIPLVTVSERLKIIANQLGFQQVFVTCEPSDEAIVEAVAHTLAHGRR